jgi:hypothetical protein
MTKHTLKPAAQLIAGVRLASPGSCTSPGG